MKKIIINGLEFCNFGSNNYSCGMELITIYPMPDLMVQKVLNGKYPGVYLNPSAPCGEEFYGVFGTKEQYKKLYNEQKECQISKRIIEILGGWNKMHTASDEEYKNAEKTAREEYKDWWYNY